MVLAFVLWVLGVASILYFGIYAAVIGLNNSFTYFWLLLGIMFAAAGTVSWLCHHGRPAPSGAFQTEDPHRCQNE